MNSKRLHYGLVGVLVLMAVALVVGAYGANSLLSSRAQKLTGLKAKSQALQQEQLSLAGAQKSVKTYSSLEKIAESVVPQDKSQAETVRQIVNIAAANGISLASLNFPASSLGNNVPSSAASASGRAAPAAAPASSGSSSTGKLSQLLPVKNIPGVYVLQITAQSDASKPVSYSSFINFLNDLEHNRRTALISGITLQPSTANPNLLTFTLTLNEYIKP
jgi:hypothetical protein